MADSKHYDAIVIGAGQSGGPLASELQRSGRKTAIIERKHVGGTCINEGCTPTKTMYASARVAYLARRASDYGINAGPVGTEMPRVRQRKRDMVDSFRSSSERRLRETEGLDVLMGEATFTSPHEIEVRLNSGETVRMSADYFFINTGARPTVPPIEGLDKTPYVDSTSIMELDVVPEHLLVIGGGYVGLEFAQMFRRFGSQVTLVVRGNQLLAREDPDVSDAMVQILKEDGLAVLLETETLRAGEDNGKPYLVVKDKDGERTISGSHLLVSTGRSPNTEKLGLDKAGVETDNKGNINVDDHLRTNVPHIFALGDVNGGPAFTHISYDDYRIIRTNFVQGGDASTRGRFTVYTVFTDPQLGRVGVTETEARKQGLNIRVAKMPMDYIARADEMDESRGLMKAVVDAESGEILGASVLGIEGGELMAMFEIAMLGKVPYTVLKDAIFAHPTLAEGLNNLFSNFQD